MEKTLPDALKALSGAEGSVLLCGLKKALFFSGGIRTVAAYSPDKIQPALYTIQSHLNKGYYAAGFITFEAGCHLNGVKPGQLKSGFPLLCFGIYYPPEMIDTSRVLAQIKMPYMVSPLVSGTCRKEYRRVVSKIRKLLEYGELYQVNYCVNNSFDIRGSVMGLFADLYAGQPTDFSAYLNLNGVSAASASPEMFFKAASSGHIVMKPMKGTLLKPADKKKILRFKKDPKTLAENLMIVDLIRNDLGRICEPDSVKVKELFGIEEHPTLWQMTSTVTGKIRAETGVKEILNALFPSGSVTGAPKKRAIEAIISLEKEARGIYTGAIGYFAPDKSAAFNVAIRTASVYKGKGELWTGSGIVADSKAEDEYRETMGKADFFREIGGRFYIFESMLAGGGHVFLLDRHISRMRRAAREFNIRFDFKAAKASVVRFSAGIKKPAKIRMILRQTGKVEFDKKIIRAEKGPVKIALSGARLQSNDVFFRYKTSNRQAYEAALKEARAKGADDAVLVNQRGEVTETASSNIFMEKKGVYYTPPVSCGLLSGTYREYLLETAPEKYREKILRPEDLKNAEAVYICNSVRLWRKAVLIGRF